MTTLTAHTTLADIVTAQPTVVALEQQLAS